MSRVGRCCMRSSSSSIIISDVEKNLQGQTMHLLLSCWVCSRTLDRDVRFALRFSKCMFLSGFTLEWLPAFVLMQLWVAAFHYWCACFTTRMNFFLFVRRDTGLEAGAPDGRGLWRRPVELWKLHLPQPPCTKPLWTVRDATLHLSLRTVLYLHSCLIPCKSLDTISPAPLQSAESV